MSYCLRRRTTQALLLFLQLSVMVVSSARASEGQLLWQVSSRSGTAYLLGSISSAIIVCRLMRLPDPRTQGSNNPGATNVLRIGGKKAAAVTLVGDMLKGLIPVLIAKALGAKSYQLVEVTVQTGEHDHPVPVRAEAMAMASRAAVTPPAMESGTSRVVVQASGAIRLVR